MQYPKPVVSYRALEIPPAEQQRIQEQLAKLLAEILRRERGQ